MNIAETFIRRPVATTLVMLAIFVFGVLAYRSLPVSDLPTVDYPVIVVSASLPGANPETMASAVATPLEKQFSTIAGIDSMNSVSGLGYSSITLQFNLDRNIDAAAQDVQTAIAQAAPQLPQNMPSPPTYRKVNPADQPVLYLSLSSATLPLSDVDEYAETLMAQRISMVANVAQVQVFGTQKYAVRVQVDPRKLAQQGIGIDEVVNAVENANVNLPTGVLDGSKKSFTVQASGQLTKAEMYNPVIISYRKGAAVRIQDIGHAVDSVENDKVAAWYNKTRAIVLAIQKQPGSNTIRVIDDVKALLPKFRSQLPPSLELNTLYDRSVSIRQSVADVKFTLCLTIGLVIMVIFLFLRSTSATIIPSMALPFSIIGTFAVMFAMGYSVDNLSLMALTLAVGFVVDDAIVMLENIVRHMEMGESAMQAALAGSKEIGFTIITMTLSLTAVFLPVLFMPGVPGRLFREFSVTIGASILVSGFVSLTLTPMLCSRFLKPPKEAHHGHAYMVLEKFFDGMLHLYEVTLKRVLRHRVVMILSWFLSIVFVVFLTIKIPKGFFPSEDRGILFLPSEAAEGISFDDMMKHQEAIADVILKDPDVESLMNSFGSIGGFAGALNNGRTFVRLKPRDQRHSTVDQVIERLRPQLAAIPGIRCYPQNPPPIQMSATFTKAQYQFTLQGPDTKDLFEHAAELESKLKNASELRDVTTDLQIKNPQVMIDINRDKAATLGVSATQIEDALYAAYGARQVSTIFAPNNQYRVIVELEKIYQTDPSVLPLLYIRSATGQLVPLDAVATLTRNYGPLAINHFGQLPAVTISFNLKPGVSVGDAVAVVEKTARQVLPATISTQFQGTAQAFAQSMGGMGLLLIMTVMVIYIILGILYESFIHPITILSGLPSAGLGALITLMIFREDLNLYAIVGIIMLIGIVKKNAIMMIDFALEAQRAGKSPQDAIFDGCLIRFRPIMMTTMAALMGTLPIALGYGAGGEARRPLGLAVVGGLMFSQLVTLYLTPVFYTYMESLHAWFNRQRVHSRPSPITVKRPEPVSVEN